MNSRTLTPFILPNLKDIFKTRLFKAKAVSAENQPLHQEESSWKKLAEEIRILEIKIMRGPNYWSSFRHKLIVAKIELGEMENYPSNLIPGFNAILMKNIPSLIDHRCSEGHKGGFLSRLEEGTWMGHIIEHVALELQCVAGMECGFGRTRTAETKGTYTVLFDYKIEQAGVYAFKSAVNLIKAIIAGVNYDLQKDIEDLKYINAKYSFGPSTQSIIDAAVKRDIPFRRMDNGSTILFGQGVNQKKICASIAGSTSYIGVELVGDKDDTKKLLGNAYIPVPKGEIIRGEEELSDTIKKLGFPLVIKPVDGNHGRGVSTNIQTEKDAIAAFQLAQKISKRVIVENFICGDDYRFLLVDYKLVAVAKRTPAMIMGDGLTTIRELIEDVNLDPNRGEGHEKIMTKIKIDEITMGILKANNYTLDSVLKSGETLCLKDTANMSTGGTSTDVTDLVHPYNKLMAERIARLTGLNICGIDVIAKSIEEPINLKNGAIIEVNAAPGFRMHLSPSKGTARNVGEHVIDMLFPAGQPARIPVVAVTGTNGKTTTTRLVAYLAKKAGHNVGYTTTDGIYMNDFMIHEGDCTGPVSAQTVLNEPGVDFAVLECARGGILRSGLGFDKCDISIITNVSEDHLGLGGIHTLKQMKKVKAVVANSTAEDGYCILNADDERVMSMASDLECNIALFSMNPQNPYIIKHAQKGGYSAIIENGYLVTCRGKWKTRVERVENIPLTLEGRADCMIKNILPVAVVSIIKGYTVETLRETLSTFIPSPETTPGRFNIFKVGKVEVMIDYAHNKAGFEELKTFLERSNYDFVTGIVGGTGDRKKEDLKNVGRYAARMFKRIVLRDDKDLRGNTPENVNSQIMEGINDIEGEQEVVYISEELEAVNYAIDNAPDNSLVVILADQIQKVIEHMKEKERTYQQPEKFVPQEGLNLEPVERLTETAA